MGQVLAYKTQAERGDWNGVFPSEWAELAVSRQAARQRLMLPVEL